MNRSEDWPRLLARHIERSRGLPFIWGERDCCLWACDGVLAYTGVDPAAWFRGRYSTERGAYLALRRFAGGGLAEAAARICAELGWPEVRPKMAQRGDVVLAEGLLLPGGGDEARGLADALGLMGPAHLPVAFGRDGPVELRRAQVKRAWRV